MVDTARPTGRWDAWAAAKANSWRVVAGMPAWRETRWQSHPRWRLRDSRGGMAFTLAALVLTGLVVVGLMYAGAALGAW